MKIKLLVVLCLSTFLFLAGCGRGESNANANHTTATATPTAITKTTESATVDPNLKPKVEAALKAKGCADVTVDTSTPKATLRGTVAKGKMPECVAAAQEAAGKPFDNQITEK